MKKLLAMFALIFSILSGVSAIALGQLKVAYWFSYCEVNNFTYIYELYSTFRILLIVFMILATICLIAYEVIYKIQELKKRKKSVEYFDPDP